MATIEQKINSKITRRTVLGGLSIGAAGLLLRDQDKTATAALTKRTYIPIGSKNSVIESPPPPPRYPYGVNLSIYGNYPSMWETVPQVMDRLRADKTAHLTIVYPIYTPNYTSTDFYEDPNQTPKEPTFSMIANEAAKRGFSLSFRPLLDEGNLSKDGHWRGTLEPWDAGIWFQNYKTLLDKHTRLANKLGVRNFIIGSEFESLEQFSDQWISIADMVRANITSGKASYAYNWGELFNRKTGFEDKLDYTGIDWYFPLNLPDTASVDQISNGLREQVNRVAASGRDLKKVWATEIGCVPYNHAYYELWNNAPSPIYNRDVQLKYYQAVAQVFIKEQAIGRADMWYASSLVPNETPYDYNILYKPIEDILKGPSSGFSAQSVQINSARDQAMRRYTLAYNQRFQTK